MKPVRIAGLLLVVPWLTAHAQGEGIDHYPKAAAAYLVAVDGSIIWGRSLDTPRAPASLAKIMTALVLLEGGFDANEEVAVGASAAAATGSRLGLRAGDVTTAGDLLNGMLVRSANDAAVALTEHAAGSVPAFVVRMNRRARSLGLGATRFKNPTGLDAPGQTSSARDVLVLTEAALALPEFASRVALRRATVATAKGRRFDVETSNALLGRVPGACGVKTGTTAGAGDCVVALAERGGHRVIVVLLDAKDRWWTAAALIEAAFREASVQEPSAPR